MPTRPRRILGHHRFSRRSALLLVFAAAVIAFWARSRVADDRIALGASGYQLRSHDGRLGVDNAHVWEDYWARLALAEKRRQSYDVDPNLELQRIRAAADQGAPEYRGATDLPPPEVMTRGVMVMRMPPVPKPATPPLAYALPYLVLLGVVPLCWLFGHARRRHVAAVRRQGLCPTCRYDLRASPGRCPECGTAADPTPIEARSPAGGPPN